MLCAAGVVAGGILVSGQTTQIPEPRRGSGASVTGAFEGWFYNPDGSRSFLVGYYNRNSQQTLDIPIGPNNRIEPGGPDMGQPTHFLPGRQWGMFTVSAPKEFKPTDSYVWTIVANGQTTSIPLRLNPDYVMSPFTEIAVGNTPPVHPVRAGRKRQGAGTTGEHRDRAGSDRGARDTVSAHRLGHRRLEIHERHQRAAERQPQSRRACRSRNTEVPVR